MRSLRYEKVVQAMKDRYGEDYYSVIAQTINIKKGFASEKLDKNGMNGFLRSKIYGSIGGQNSSHRRMVNKDSTNFHEND